MYGNSQGPEADPQTAWARVMGADVADFKHWLVLGAALEYMKRLNRATQRTKLRVSSLEGLVAATEQEPEKYTAPGSGRLACALPKLFEPARVDASADSR